MASRAIADLLLSLVAKEGLEGEIGISVHAGGQLQKYTTLLVRQPAEDPPGEVDGVFTLLGFFRDPVDVDKGIVDSSLGALETMDLRFCFRGTARKG